MIEKLKSPFLLKLFLWRKLPLAFAAGLRVIEFTDEKASVSIPFNWITKNPFKSMYFAAQSMAAEFSTAVLGVLYLEKSEKNVAIIITGLKAEFFKKAQSKVTFTCNDGHKYREAFASKNLQEGFEVEAMSEGRDQNGELVSRFFVTWSFKERTKRTS